MPAVKRSITVCLRPHLGGNPNGWKLDAEQVHAATCQPKLHQIGWDIGRVRDWTCQPERLEGGEFIGAKLAERFVNADFPVASFSHRREEVLYYWVAGADFFGVKLPQRLVDAGFPVPTFSECIWASGRIAGSWMLGMFGRQALLSIGQAIQRFNLGKLRQAPACGCVILS